MMVQIISIIKSIKVAIFTDIGLIAPEMPRINSRLNIFEPTTFPIARPVSPFLAATIDVTNSGRDVPAV